MNSKHNNTTIRDVARRAGVSVATVSRFINQTTVVSPEVSERLAQVMAELKYVPRAAARNLATHRTNTLGLLLDAIHGDFFAPLFYGIEAASRAAGYNLLISTSSGLADSSGFSLPLGPHNTDGLLIFTNTLDTRGITYCYESGLPVVLIHQSAPNGLDIPCVTVENKAATCKIVEHLIEAHQRRRIVFLRGLQDNEDSFWRESGYQEALQTHGIPLDPALISEGQFEREIAQASISNLLSAGVQFDAVFSGDDEAAVGVLEALRLAGRRVPQDVSVVGFDDQRLSAFLSPPLTTVRAPTEKVGYEAVQQLLRLIRTGRADPLTLLPTEMIIRSSCGCSI
jgi:LacI family transcriptional regulator, galactose operon repressor